MVGRETVSEVNCCSELSRTHSLFWVNCLNLACRHQCMCLYKRRRGTPEIRYKSLKQTTKLLNGFQFRHRHLWIQVLYSDRCMRAYTQASLLDCISQICTASCEKHTFWVLELFFCLFRPCVQTKPRRYVRKGSLNKRRHQSRRQRYANTWRKVKWRLWFVGMFKELSFDRKSTLVR